MTFFAGLSVYAHCTQPNNYDARDASSEYFTKHTVEKKWKFALSADLFLVLTAVTIAILAILSMQGVHHLGPISGIKAMGTPGIYAMIGVASGIVALDVALIIFHIRRFIHHQTTKIEDLTEQKKDAEESKNRAEKNNESTFRGMTACSINKDTRHGRILQEKDKRIEELNEKVKELEESQSKAMITNLRQENKRLEDNAKQREEANQKLTIQIRMQNIRLQERTPEQTNQALDQAVEHIGRLEEQLVETKQLAAIGLGKVIVAAATQGDSTKIY